MGPKKNGVIIKILYDVIKEKVFLISLLVTWAKTNVLIKGDVTISGVIIEEVDCILYNIVIKYSILISLTIIIIKLTDSVKSHDS